MAPHPTFYVGRLKRYHDPLGPPSRTEDDNSPPRNEAESSGQPELPVSKPVTDTQADTHASHTKGMTVQSGKKLGSRNSAVNTPMEVSGLTTKSVQILTKDLKGPRLAQPDHQVQAQGLSRSRKRDLDADGPRRLTGTCGEWFYEIARSLESSCTLRPNCRLTEGVLRSSVRLLDLTLCTRRWD
ncbi:Pol protein [Phytophthora palmivora]|uniref:Pol protein n=1 Tax=Phytophthora palmivora TaxID=4796 RepID=A0A2P4X3M2_9STRA|nr:Pol protein [Phytophthora palmivora]